MALESFVTGITRFGGPGFMIYVPLRIAGGFVLIFLGVAGLLLPVMPGLIFLIPGLALLARHFHWAERLHGHLREAQRFCWRSACDMGLVPRRLAAWVHRRQGSRWPGAVTVTEPIPTAAGVCQTEDERVIIGA